MPIKQWCSRAGTMLLHHGKEFCTRCCMWLAVRSNRIRLAVSLLCGAAFWIVLTLAAYPAAGAFGCAGVLGTLLYWVQEKRVLLLSRTLWLLGPLVSFFAVECMIGNWVPVPYSCMLSGKEILLNLVWYYMVAGLLYGICGRRKLSAILCASFFLVIGLIDSYFFAFRGRVIFPSDLLALRTAMNVIGEYQFLPSAEQVEGALLIAVYVLGMALTPRSHGRVRQNWRVVVPVTVLCVGYVAVFFFSPFLARTGFEGKLWTSLWRTRENGVVLNFTINLRYSTLEKPDDYDERIAALTQAYESEPSVTDPETVCPNIIAIMNESLCDLSVLGISTNEPSMPFLQSLTEHTIKGYTYVSVFGGHTANSEYEFLTGNSISFLPVGTVAYQMFTHPGDYSLVGQLKQMGYYSIAMHPYASSGWNRVSVYQRYGFDEMHFIEDFQQLAFIRDYCSDWSNYENLISVYEQHRSGTCANQPLFLFNVTMQNHGGYTANWDGLKQTVWLTGELENQFEAVDMYLSLARESDLAFQKLVEYFQTVQEPTVILMFGDHQPGLANEFYEAVFGVSKDSLSPTEAMCLYQVPYVIWANYDLEEKSYADCSLNYLSTVLLDAISYPKTGYQQFLSEMMQSLPILTRNFYQDALGAKSGNPADLSAQAQAFLADYRVLQYHGIKAGSKRVDAYFNLIPGAG